MAPSLPLSLPPMAILYVRDVVASVRFYARLFDTDPREASDGFAMFAGPGGAALGLWVAPGVQPPATAPGGSELAWPVPDDAALHALHERWVADGLTVLQPPQRMDFGLTCTAADPDGHRLRAFSPSGD